MVREVGKVSGSPEINKPEIDDRHLLEQRDLTASIGQETISVSSNKAQEYTKTNPSFTANAQKIKKNKITSKIGSLFRNTVSAG
jgi:hypothetical protein